VAVLDSPFRRGPLEEMAELPGTPVIQNGYLVPSDAPGFGLEIDQAWINCVSR